MLGRAGAGDRDDVRGAVKEPGEGKCGGVETSVLGHRVEGFLDGAVVGPVLWVKARDAGAEFALGEGRRSGHRVPKTPYGRGGEGHEGHSQLGAALDEAKLGCRVQSEYSFWTAMTGWTAWQRSRV